MKDPFQRSFSVYGKGLENGCESCHSIEGKSIGVFIQIRTSKDYEMIRFPTFPNPFDPLDLPKSPRTNFNQYTSPKAP